MSDHETSGFEELDPELEEIEEVEESDEGSSDHDPDYESRKNKRMTEAEYAEIREKFELGLKRMVELADEYGFTRQAIRKRFDKDQVKWGSRAHELKQAVGSGLKSAAASSAEKFAEQRLDWIEEARVSARKDSRQGIAMAKKAVIEALQKSLPLSTVDDDLKAIQRYNRVLQDAYRFQLEVLRAGDEINEDDLPTLTVDDLTADRVVQFHRDQGITDEEELDEILNNYTGASTTPDTSAATSKKESEE